MIRSGRDRKLRRLERKISIYKNEIIKCKDFLEFIFYNKQLNKREERKNRCEKMKKDFEIILNKLKERFRLSCLYQDTGNKEREQTEVFEEKMMSALPDFI